MPHKDIDVRKAYRRRRYEKLMSEDPEYRSRRNEYFRNHRRNHPELGRAAQMKYKFGLSLEDIERMTAEQCGRCAICFRDLNGKPYVDHDHTCCPSQKSCGKCVRGLLCMMCNSAIGMMEDDIERLKSSIEYLEKYKNAESESWRQVNVGHQESSF